jgi:hypothetical protein
MRYLPALLLLSCGSAPSGDPDVDALAWDLCSEYGALCIPSGVKEDLGLIEDSDIGWGAFYYRTFDLPAVSGYVGVVCYDDEKCREDLAMCGFVILHEIGHLREGENQSDADCYAAARSTPEQYAAGLAYICEHGWRERCAALTECAP